MSQPTGYKFTDTDGVVKDFADVFTAGNSLIPTGYFSQAYGNDLGNIFASGSSSKVTNYKTSNGTDLGSLFTQTPPFSFTVSGGPGTNTSLYSSGTGGYFVKIFSGTANITLNVTPSQALRLYVMAGGGGGCGGLGITSFVTTSYGGGGGAAGGYFNGNCSAVANNTIAVQAGAAGNGGIGSNGAVGTNGGTSTVVFSGTGSGNQTVTCSGGTRGLPGNKPTTPIAPGGTVAFTGSFSTTSFFSGANGGGGGYNDTGSGTTIGSSAGSSNSTSVVNIDSTNYTIGGGGGGGNFTSVGAPSGTYAQAGTAGNGSGGTRGSGSTNNPIATYCTGTSPPTAYGAGGGGGGSYYASPVVPGVNVNGGSGSAGFVIVFIKTSGYTLPISST
jgi:hypothetical protein